MSPVCLGVLVGAFCHAASAGERITEDADREYQTVTEHAVEVPLSSSVSVGMDAFVRQGDDEILVAEHDVEEILDRAVVQVGLSVQCGEHVAIGLSTQVYDVLDAREVVTGFLYLQVSF